MYTIDMAHAFRKVDSIDAKAHSLSARLLLFLGRKYQRALIMIKNAIGAMRQKLNVNEPWHLAAGLMDYGQIFRRTSFYDRLSQICSILLSYCFVPS
jgi:hypothetical protein